MDACMYACKCNNDARLNASFCLVIYLKCKKDGGEHPPPHTSVGSTLTWLIGFKDDRRRHRREKKSGGTRATRRRRPQKQKQLRKVSPTSTRKDKLNPSTGALRSLCGAGMKGMIGCRGRGRATQDDVSSGIDYVGITVARSAQPLYSLAVH